MASFKVDGSNNMSTLDLSTISNGTIAASTASEIIIRATDGTTYALYGSFTGGDGSTLPTSGTISRWVSIAPDGSRVAMLMNLPVATFERYLTSGNAIGLEHTIFAGNDGFDLTAGSGQNTVLGGAGNDIFKLGGTLDAQDTIDGGSGVNTLVLNGNYADLTLGDSTLTDINKIDLTGANSYDITTADGTVAANHTLFVDAKTIRPGGTLTFDGSAETNGSFKFFLGAAPGSSVTGGAGNDYFYGGGSGVTMNGGAGNDHFVFGPNFDGTDNIDGGTGVNTVELRGDYSAGLTFGADSLQNIQHLIVGAGDSYDLTLSPTNVEAGQSLKVYGSALHSPDTLTFDGSLAQGDLFLIGGEGNDTLTGGSARNTFTGGLGADTLNAGSSVNNFVYNHAAESTGPTYDTINGFDADRDHFILNVTVSGVDKAVAAGSLSTATFNADLTLDVGSAQLGAHDAVLFTASAGSLAGDTFLIVDENGTAGYQAGHDLVIQLTNTHNMGDFGTGNFMT
jgi:Ca2+-binding RTX toxin-like protein